MSDLDDLFICTNPTRRDVKNIYRNEQYARGIILKNGDVMVWNGEVRHSQVTPYLPEVGIHFSIFNNKLEVCWQFESWRDIQNRLVQAKKVLEVLGYSLDGRIEIDTMFYTHSQKAFPQIQYRELFLPDYELKPLDEM